MRGEHTYIRTATGGKAWPLDAQPQDIRILDIAHALSHAPRFNGHTRHFYSVAQHSLMVAQLVNQVSPSLRLVALLHDATEAYLCDMPRPLKQAESFGTLYRHYEGKLAEVIGLRFGIQGLTDLPRVVKDADNFALVAEARELMSEDADWTAIEKRIETVFPQPLLVVLEDPAFVREKFLHTFNALTDGAADTEYRILYGHERPTDSWEYPA